MIQPISNVGVNTFKGCKAPKKILSPLNKTTNLSKDKELSSLVGTLSSLLLTLFTIFATLYGAVKCSTEKVNPDAENVVQKDFTLVQEKTLDILK